MGYHWNREKVFFKVCHGCSVDDKVTSAHLCSPCQDFVGLFAILQGRRQEKDTPACFFGDIANVVPDVQRSEEHTSELQSLMTLSHAVFCFQKTKLSHHTWTLPTNEVHQSTKNTHHNATPYTTLRYS